MRRLAIILGLIWSLCLPIFPAATTTTGGMPWPEDLSGMNMPPGTSTGASSASTGTSQLSVVFKVSKAGSIHRIGYSMSSGITSVNTMQAGIYNVSTTSGTPLNTLYGGCAVGTHALTAADSSNVIYITLGTDATAVAGDIVAATLSFVSYTSGTVTLLEMSAAGGRFPYLCTSANSGSTWGKQTPNPILFIEYSDGSYDWNPGLLPYQAITQQTFTSGPEYAMGFALPFPAKLLGFGINSTLAADLTVNLYAVGGSTTTLGVIDKDQWGQTSTGGYAVFQTSVPVSLTAGTTYRLAFQASSAGTETIYLVSCATFTFATPWGQQAGGTTIYESTRNATTDQWANLTQNRIFANLILGNFDNGVSSGGSQKVWGGHGG